MSTTPEPAEAGTDDGIFDYGGVDDRDDDGILDPELSLGEDAEDELADGWTAPDAAQGLDEYGNTVAEQRAGESLDDRELRSLPDLGAGVADDRDDLPAEEAAIHRIDPQVDPLVDAVDPATGIDPDSPIGEGDVLSESYVVDEGSSAG